MRDTGTGTDLGPLISVTEAELGGAAADAFTVIVPSLPGVGAGGAVPLGLDASEALARRWRSALPGPPLPRTPLRPLLSLRSLLSLTRPINQVFRISSDQSERKD